VAALAVERFGRIDLLVNGAAGNFLAPFAKLSEKGFRTVMEIDAVGTFNMSKAVFHTNKLSGGSIINISATLQTGVALQAHSASAKAAIDAMTRVLAVELGRHQIRVNSIAPGPIAGT
jgi:peroxisomal 2,4-dienoyl-CoA reductase